MDQLLSLPNNGKRIIINHAADVICCLIRKYTAAAAAGLERERERRVAAMGPCLFLELLVGLLEREVLLHHHVLLLHHQQTGTT